MKRERKHKFSAALAAFTAFILWTAAVCTVDVQTVGPRGSSVGLASFNRAVHNFTGVHWKLYCITDWLGLVPVAFMFGFALLGLWQLGERKDIRKVDRSILLLGGLYLVVAAAYLLFEEFAVNYRPVLIGGFLEASYPSSTTLLVLTVMPTAAAQLRRRSVTAATTVFSALMVAGRALSGVHWISDIIGGALLSFSLVMLYLALAQ